MLRRAGGWDAHDARGGAGLERGEQQLRQQKVPQVVRLERQLVAVDRRVAGVRRAPVIDEHVQPLVVADVRDVLLREAADGGERGQVELHLLDPRQLRLLEPELQLPHRLSAALGVAAGQHDAGAGGDHHARQLGAHAIAGARDDGALARHVHVVHHHRHARRPLAHVAEQRPDRRDHHREGDGAGAVVLALLLCGAGRRRSAGGGAAQSSAAIGLAHPTPRPPSPPAPAAPPRSPSSSSGSPRPSSSSSARASARSCSPSRVSTPPGVSRGGLVEH